MNAPLTEAQIRELGYEIQRDGSWRLVRPEARPKPRPGLCRGCQKFDATLDGLCAGCAYFGIGDPHGRREQEPERSAEQSQELPETPADDPTPREKLRARLRARARGEVP